VIKAGTLCIVIAANGVCSHLLGRIFTVTGPLVTDQWATGYINDLPVPSPLARLLAEPDAIKPLDDPDAFARDPAYTKRPERMPA